MSIEDRRIPRRPEEEAAGVFQVEDVGEAQTRAATEKPFRDAATDEGRSDIDKEVLGRVADEKGDRTGQEYRELKELLPTEVINKLSKAFEQKLEGSKFDKDRHFATSLPDDFAELMKEIRTRKAEREKMSGKRFELRTARELGISPQNTITNRNPDISGFPDRHNSYLSEDAENALYQTLGVGETRLDVIEAFQRLSEEQRKELASTLRDREGSVSESGYAIDIPTSIDGIVVYLNKHVREKNPSVVLKFTPEFLAREIK